MLMLFSTLAKKQATRSNVHAPTRFGNFPFLDGHRQRAWQEGVVDPLVPVPFVFQVALETHPLASDVDVIFLRPRILVAIPHPVHHVACVNQQVVVEEEMSVILTSSNP